MDLHGSITAAIEPLNERLDRVAAAYDQHGQTLRDQVAGFKYLRQTVTAPAGAAAATIQLPFPEPGYMWDVRLISGTLSANDSVAAYIGDTATNNPRLIGYAAAPGAAPAQFKFVINPASHSALTNAGEGIFLSTSGTGNITLAMVGYIEFPAEKVGVLLI